MQQQDDLFDQLKNTHLNRERQFWALDWALVLGDVELKVWHLCNAYAIDKDDATVRQTSAEIAARLGYEGDPSTIRRARSALAAMGLIEQLAAPRGVSPMMKMLMPGDPSKNRTARERLAARRRSAGARRAPRKAPPRAEAAVGSAVESEVKSAVSSEVQQPDQTPDSAERSATSRRSAALRNPERSATHPVAQRYADPERSATSSICYEIPTNTAAACDAGGSEPIAMGMDAAAVEGMEAEAKAILDAAGFPADDGIRRHPNAELPLLRDLALNADFLASIGQLVSRRAYFAKGIEERYGPDSRRVAAEMSAARAAKADAAKRAAAERAEQVRRQSVTSGQDQRDAEARDQATLAALPADRLAALVATAMEAANPVVRARWAKLASPIESPTLRAEMLALLRAEAAGQAIETAIEPVGRVA